uniref:Uncharacterized protein n=1 Tax=Macrostomum lignano TaxID=282301 RepID=A0A1I8JF74_9PLAT
MQPAFACPLASQSRFCLSGPSVQRNCNATDLHLQDYCGDSQLPASEKDQRSSHFAARSERTAGTDGAGGGGGGRRVEFASGAAARSQSRRSRGSRGQLKQPAQPLSLSALLVPLSCSNQSNKRHPLPGCWSASNAQLSTQTESATPKTQQTSNNPCGVPASSGGGGGGQELMKNCGVPYWNVYEYEEFRELQHGNSHLFDPQVDINLHRENIILDNYNRLLRSCSNFLPPTSMYHHISTAENKVDAAENSNLLK